MAQLDQNLCRRRKTKRKRERERERKETKRRKRKEISSIVFQPNPPHLSFTPPSPPILKILVATYALLQHFNPPQNQNIHHFSLSQKNNVFNFPSPRFMWGFLGFVLVRVFTEKTGTPKEENFLPSYLTSPPLHPYLSFPFFTISCPLFSLFLFPQLFILSPSLSIHIPPFCLLPYFSWLFPRHFLDLIMSKKMKRVVFDSSTYGSREDAKARVKHQSLLQEYQDLHKEAEAARNKLETMKQRKLTLLAEVSFLRRRLKLLLKNKPLKHPQWQELTKPQPIETHQQKYKQKDRIRSKKEVALKNSLPIFNLNQKGRVYLEKTVALPNLPLISNLKQKAKLRSMKEVVVHKATPASDRKQKGKTNRGKGGKEGSLLKATPIIDLNQKEWANSAAVLRNSAPVFDSEQKGNTYGSNEATVQTRAPVFDLNQISLEEEEEFQENCEPVRFEESKGLIRRGLDEQIQHNELRLSVCRNIGDGSTSRPGKRKISWQDPVALRV